MCATAALHPDEVRAWTGYIAGLSGGDPAHRELDHLREWAPPDFDPTVFDMDEATAAMRSVRPLEGW